MKWFDALSLRGKLLVNFVFCAGVPILAIVFCVLQIQQTTRAGEEISRNWMPSIVSAARIGQERLRHRVRSLEYMLPGTPEEKSKIAGSLGKLGADVQKALESHKALVSSEEEGKALAGAQAAFTEYSKAVDEAVKLAESGSEDQAQQIRKERWVATANQLRDQVDLLRKINEEGAERSGRNAGMAMALAINGSLVALAVGVVVAVGFSFWFARRLQRRLSAAVVAAQKIAQGDLSGTLPPAARDEIGQLVGAMAAMQEALRSAIGETRNQADAVAGAAGTLLGNVEVMEGNAQAQSAVASAIAANVEQLTVSINHVTDNTRDASRLAAESDQRARAGHETVELAVTEIGNVQRVVQQAAEHIHELEQQSGRISEIVVVIKDIAEQTNLLALNAAIEAARAGEQGRGFAVVADEVRKLSERTAQSTGEITRMIGTIQGSTREAVSGIQAGVQSVERGVALTGEAGAAIAELQEMARRVAALVEEIATALQEQSAASTDVAQRIEQIAQHAEETNASTAQTGGAARSLEEISGRLMAAVTRFRL
ncbi:methyl-accepting chemotaxis protein [Niveibacterium sp. SC-1]|uniref:methyl-accepting chemotaxis protein n=1 Tax=Niveibacterium sp. SC-1 TaxID=3135646 RepID=UPI00311E1AFE